MEGGGAPAATAEPAPEQVVPEHGGAPAADLFPFTSAAPAVVVVTVDAPAGAEEQAAAPGAKAPVVFSPTGSGKDGVATFLTKHVEVRARGGAAALQLRRSGASRAVRPDS